MRGVKIDKRAGAKISGDTVTHGNVTGCKVILGNVAVDNVTAENGEGG